MRNRSLRYLLGILLLILGVIPLNPRSASAFSGAGTGAALDPFVITTCVQLQEMEDDLDAHYALGGNINCAASSSWNSGLGFDPVGDDLAKFSGSLDGNGFTVSNLFINRADDDLGRDGDDESYVGIIGYLDGGTVRDLNVADTKVKGYEYVGGVAGYADNEAVIENVNFNLATADNSCDPGNCVWARWGVYGGGVVGYATGVTLTDLHTGGPVKGSGSFIGGIVGYLANSTLADSSAASNVDGGFTVGGVAGDITGSTVTSTTASGNAVGQDEGGKSSTTIGGFAGSISFSEISDSGATGDVEATGNTIGGFAGFTGCLSSFTNVYAEGDVAGVDAVGGFSGWDEDCGEDQASQFTNVYASGEVEGVNTVGGLIGLSEFSMISQSFASGAVTGDGNETGGLVGSMLGFTGGAAHLATVDQSFATGAVAGNNELGGLIGLADGVTVTDSYARGNVDGSMQPGGFIGTVADNGRATTVINAFAANEVMAGVYPQGVIGKDDGEMGIITNTFWDDDIGPNVSYGGTPKSTAEMKLAATFTTELGGDAWDFDAIWGLSEAVNDGYPCLQWSDEGCAPFEDLNGDGLPDTDQPNVGGYVSSLTGKIVAIDVGDGCELIGDDMTTESQLAVQDPAYEYSNGLWDFEADCGTPGFTTTITLYYYDINPDGKVLRKHNPATNAFTTIADADISTATIDSHAVTVVAYGVTDGGDRDTDGATDGFITDPAGLAALIVGAPNTGLGKTR